MKTVLTIAGSDSIGGAGIQADLKTMSAHGVYGMCVITALTAQNTMGVQAIHTPPPQFVRQQIDSVFNDIRPDAVKIGMLANASIMHAVANGLKAHEAQNIILDPVMISTSGHRLLEDDACKAMFDEMLPLASLVTPNLPEAEELASMKVSCREEMIKAAYAIAEKCSSSVLIKGGHLEDCADDLLLADGNIHWFKTEHIDCKNTHGTGCTLSSAIASNLARGHNLQDAIRLAKDYITNALHHDPHLGHGNGPLNHLYKLTIDTTA